MHADLRVKREVERQPSLSTKETSARADSEGAARACLVRYGPKRLRISRLFEILIGPLLKFTGPKPPDPGREPSSILVVDYWYLGDLVMLTPFLKNLRLHYPRSHVAIWASPRVIPLLEGQGLVDEVIPVNVPWAQHLSRWNKYVSRHWVHLLRSIRALRTRRFDLGFTVRADIRDNFLLWAGGVRQRVGYGFGYGGSLLTDVATPDLSRPHYSDRWLRLLEYLGKPILDRQPELKLGPEEKRTVRQFLMELGIQDTDAIIGVHAGARNRVRQWGEQNFFEVAQRLAKSFPVKVLWFREPGSPDPIGGPGLLSVDLPLREFLAVLSECRLLICNDTGPMHLATALGIPVVAVFGPGMSAWWGPRCVGSKVVAHEGVWCRPCFDYCIFDQPYCLRAVSVEAVFEASAEALNSLLLKTKQGVTSNESTFRVPEAKETAC